MRKRSSKKRPVKDVNVLAANIVQAATDQPDTLALAQDEISRVMAAMGRRGGLKGGKARAKALSAEKRRQIARKAARRRWRKG